MPLDASRGVATCNNYMGWNLEIYSIDYQYQIFYHFDVKILIFTKYIINSGIKYMYRQIGPIIKYMYR